MIGVANTKENGLEALIVEWLVNKNHYEQGSNADYNKEYAIDETRLFRFLHDTQPDQMDKLGVASSEIKKKQFLNRLQGEIAKRGIVDVLRNGVKIYPADLIMFYLTPTENNAKSKEMFCKNIFSVTRQLRYSIDATRLALDMCIFINGLPVITFELKNQLTKQSTADAVEQYKNDRDPRELLFSFKRCMVHFALDDSTIKFCTRLAGKDSWFLPFDKGYNDGAGNPLLSHLDDTERNGQRHNPQHRPEADSFRHRHAQHLDLPDAPRDRAVCRQRYPERNVGRQKK